MSAEDIPSDLEIHMEEFLEHGPDNTLFRDAGKLRTLPSTVSAYAAFRAANTDPSARYVEVSVQNPALLASARFMDTFNTLAARAADEKTIPPYAFSQPDGVPLIKRNMWAGVQSKRGHYVMS